MSKIAKKPVEITEGIQVSLENGRRPGEASGPEGEIKVSGPKGNLSFIIPEGVNVKIEEEKILVSQSQGNESAKALSGLVRANIANMVKGVTKGFEKKLELSGVGYRAQASGNSLTLSVGFSHPVKIDADPTVTFGVDENIITVSGSDKALIGDIASKIRAVRPPEPYKGKGIKYQGEYIRRKVGKAAKAVGAAGAK